jgi:Acetyl/propionyl-CoA carboxylase, alpha subunit
MAYAYSPGLKVLKSTVLRRNRRLPIKGQTLVKIGDKVGAEQVVLKTELPGKADVVNVMSLLGCQPHEVKQFMVKPIGEHVEKGELLAMRAAFFGLFKTRIESPMSGTIESVSDVSGQVVMRGAPVPVDVKAYIDGKVVEADEGEHVTVEVTGSFIQGIFGVGGETYGRIVVASSDPNGVLDENSFSEEMKGAVVVGGSLITYNGLQKAIEVGVNAVVVGGFDDADLKKFLGFDLGVAITGHEELGLTLVLTEGFGQIPMADKTFALLKECEGKNASVNGATQIRAGVMRPEIIVARDEEASMKENEAKLILDIGTRVRVIREPYFGLFGTVTALPAELTKLPTESLARVLDLKFDDGTVATVPRANVEIMATEKDDTAEN